MSTSSRRFWSSMQIRMSKDVKSERSTFLAREFKAIPWRRATSMLR